MTNRFSLPWTFEVDYCTDTGASWVVVDSTGEAVAEGTGDGAQMQHAVACVNAMHAAEDPDVMLQHVRDFVEDLRAAQTGLRINR